MIFAPPQAVKTRLNPNDHHDLGSRVLCTRKSSIPSYVSASKRLEGSRIMRRTRLCGGRPSQRGPRPGLRADRNSDVRARRRSSVVRACQCSSGFTRSAAAAPVGPRAPTLCFFGEGPRRGFDRRAIGSGGGATVNFGFLWIRVGSFVLFSLEMGRECELWICFGVFFGRFAIFLIGTVRFRGM